MEFKIIIGFDNLTEREKELFKQIYYKHQAALGSQEKSKYTPTKVILKANHFKVSFINGEWLHYTFRKEWY